MSNRVCGHTRQPIETMIVLSGDVYYDESFLSLAV